jgi:hypothetical protein
MPPVIGAWRKRWQTPRIWADRTYERAYVGVGPVEAG